MDYVVPVNCCPVPFTVDQNRCVTLSYFTACTALFQYTVTHCYSTLIPKVSKSILTFLT